MEWKEFVNQQINENWISLGELPFDKFKNAVKMCKGCAVTIKEMQEIVKRISHDYNMSPHDSFDLFKHYGKGKI